MEKTQIIILKDFALETEIAHVFNNEFYTKTNKWPHSRKLWLYIKYPEEYYEKYLFDEKASIYIAGNLEFNNLVSYNRETGKTSLPEKKKNIFPKI